MFVRIIAIRLDDCYIVSNCYELENISLKSILKVMGNETSFDEFLVIDSSLGQKEFYNRTKQNKSEEEEE